MPSEDSGQRSVGGVDRGGVPADVHEFEMALHESRIGTAAPTGSAREQLERDIDAIERAVAALRRTEPGFQGWSAEPRRKRAVWLLVAGVWAIAGLITVGAIAALGRLIR